MDGWICLQRRFLEWEWFDDDTMVKLFIYLLLKANFDAKMWHGIVIERGQLVTSTKHLAQELHKSEQQIKTRLMKLRNTGEITTKATNKFTIVTICNYAKYQSITNEEQPTKELPNNQQTNQQPNYQITTTKQINNKQINNKNIFKSKKSQFNPEELLKDEPEETKMLLFRWIDYKKKQFGKSYKSDDSFKTFIKKLYQLSGGDFETAKAIIEQSIANTYQGIFELKKQNYGRNDFNNPTSPDYVSTERIIAAGRAMAEAGM